MTELYKLIMKKAEQNGSDLELQHMVWDPTPWVIQVQLGDPVDTFEYSDEREIMDYCLAQFGPESWPIHNKPAAWYRGGATVNGVTWLGFATEQMMQQFMADWPNNVEDN